MIRSLTDDEAIELLYDWKTWARPEQLPPVTDWQFWLVLAGRGWGKTQTGAGWVQSQAERYPKSQGALIGATSADVRDVMVGGKSGLLKSVHPSRRPTYLPSNRLLTWPNGTTALTFSADEPERLRGPQFHWAWGDEFAAWRYPDEAWDNLLFGLRLGENPRAIVTTTPKPTKQVRAFVADPLTAVTRGNTYENRANLAKNFLTRILKKYEGTRLGRQELFAEILDDNPGALWSRPGIDKNRVSRKSLPELVRIVVAVDPAVTSDANSAETGIVVAGLGTDGHGYVLDDKSLTDTPAKWAAAACNAYHASKADRIVGEVNNGGDLVEVNIRTVDKDVSYKAVRASRGKQTRAEPIAALYEQGRVHHVGELPQLEDQLCDWDPAAGARSPDRLDAAVWALTDLMLGDADGAEYTSSLVRSSRA